MIPDDYTVVFPPSESHNNVGVAYNGKCVRPFCGNCATFLVLNAGYNSLQCPKCSRHCVTLFGGYTEDPGATVRVFLGELEDRMLGEKVWGGKKMMDPTYAELLSMIIARWTERLYSEISVN